MAAPQSEIMVDRGPGGQIMRQTAPGHTARAATRLEGRHFRLQQLPFRMRQITRVGGSSHRITLRNVGCYVGDEDPHPTSIYAIWHFSYTLLGDGSPIRHSQHRDKKGKSVGSALGGGLKSQRSRST